MDRRLNLIPLIHSLRDSMMDAKSVDRNEEIAAQVADLVIPKFLADVEFDPKSTKVYHDSLPNLSSNAVYVAVEDFYSFRYAKILSDRGAKVIGTESASHVAELGIFINWTMAAEDDVNTRRFREIITANVSKALMGRRDRYVAKRINKTLKEGETGFLLMGADHRVELHLDPDIGVQIPGKLFDNLPSILTLGWVGKENYDRYCRIGLMK